MNQFLNLITERESIRQKHDAGLPPPWTNNAILRDYKFCNIEREQDRASLRSKLTWTSRNWK